MSNLYVCVHILQDIPPANLNRDDNGTPKRAVYGGVERLRVSSQAWKRATRKQFEAHLPKDRLGVRTRRLQGLLTAELTDRGKAPDEAAILARASLATLKITDDKATAAKEPVDKRRAEYSAYLLFAGRAQLAQLADALAEEGADPKQVDAASILGSLHPLDVALFGRMVAHMAKLNVDAAAQVAHAISTHAASPQFDYFTAVDDEQGSDEQGAGMIGTVEFNSGTLYRYAVVGLEQLVDNMGDREAAIAGVAAFVESFVHSLPSGKQNSFAAHTRPGVVLVEVRGDQPVSLVSAFEAPVRAHLGSGYMAESQRALADFHSREAARWGDRPEVLVASYTSSGKAEEALAAAFGPSVPLAELTARITSRLSESSMANSDD